MEEERRISNSKITSSFFWVLVEKFGYSGINLLCVLVLARLVTPYEFGLVGAVTIIISISNMIAEAGMGAALVNKKNANQTDYNTMFTFNLLMSTALCLIIFFAAPYIADYFGKPILKNVVQVLSTTLFFNALVTVPRVILIRKLLFKKQSFISITALLLSVIIAVFVAFQGGGVWAIVTQLVLYAFLSFVFTFLAIRYVPKLEFSVSSFKELVGFGGPVVVSSAIQVGYNDIISSVIAKIYSIQITGFYTQSKKLVDFPTAIFQSLFSTAVFPILSKAKDKKEFRELGSKINRGIYFLAFPLLLVIPFNTENIIHIVLGKQWIEASEIFRILSVSIIFLLINAASFNLLKSAGKSRVFLNAGIAKAIIGLAMLAVSATFSISVLLYGIIFTNLAASVIVINYVNLVTLYDTQQQIRDIVIPLSIAGVANGIAFLVTQALNFHYELVHLLTYIGVMFLIFLFLCWIIGVQELVFFVKKIIKK